MVSYMEKKRGAGVLIFHTGWAGEASRERRGMCEDLQVGRK